MITIRTLIQSTALTVAVSGAAAAQDMKAEVLHWWTSGGESAAVKVFADAFTADGGEWIDTAIAVGENARAAGINRIVGGEPPTVMQFNTGKQFDELVSEGMLRDLEDIAADGQWRENLPEVIIDATVRDGKFYAVPVNIHGQNWIWYNTKVLADAGIEPPTSIGDIIAAGPKLQEAGIIPLALGGQSWQEALTLNAVMLAEGGPELYMAVHGENDIEAIRSDGFRKVAETYGALRDLVDEGSPGRSWNDATSMVITGKAAMQIMGDWAKGEFIAAGLTPGKEYGCAVPSKENGYVLGGDVFVFPIVEDPVHLAGQTAVARLMMSPEVQIAFNEKKGSVPVLLNVDVSAMDACAQEGMAIMQDAAKQIPSDNYVSTPDMVGARRDAVTQFWNNKDMSVDEFIENYVAATESAG
ncbi:MAG: carbohydrate ABC transporter substrate-binding protein [Rhizobiales bacterium]|nr:carbohydrate ABC transporter substrate-binding protein [Hyphomicrobiales bacterium]